MANIEINIAVTDDAARRWVYKDVNENLELDPVQRDLSSYYDVGAVNNSLMNLIRFKRGERLFKMDYGLDVEQFIYQPINTATAMTIGDRLKAAIEKWEPRVAIIAIDITPMPSDNSYNIILHYSIPLLGNNEYEMQYVLNGSQ